MANSSNHFLLKNAFFVRFLQRNFSISESEGECHGGHVFVCLQDLQHPNEFIRGSTLRFLCKLKEPELLEPLMPSIRSCLEHRHAYVRRNAVLAIYTIFK